MKLLQPRFPHSVGGRSISFLRVVMEDGKGQVVRVTSSYDKKAEVVAVCAVETIIPDASYRFSTAPGYTGHEELCRLLYKEGIHGSYSEWLRAIKAGDEQRAGEKERFSVIRFECDLINEEEAAAWKIKSKEEPDVDSKHMKHDEDNIDEIIADLEMRIAEAKAKLKEKAEEPETFALAFRKAALKEEAKK